jgi:ATP-dependent RNA helicase DHX37/DHR1
MIKTWARLQPRTQVLLQELMNRNVDSLESLLLAWQKDNKYLLAAYQAWLPESQHEQVAALWPPL